MNVQQWRSFARHSVVRNAVALYGIQAAQYILPWITFPYLTRVLDEKFGLIIFAQAFIQYFAAVTDYGFNFTATRDVSIHRDDIEKVSRIFSAVMMAKTLLMMGSFVAMVAITLATPALRGNMTLFLITFLTVVGNVLFPQWLFQGLEKMGYITVREIGARLLGLLPTFLLVRSRNDYLMAALIQSGSVTLAAVAGLAWMRKSTGVHFVRVTWREVRETYRGGFPLFLSIAAITIYTRSNTFALKFFSTGDQLKDYALAQKLVDAGRSLVSPLSTALFPHISRMSQRPAEAVVFIKKYTSRVSLAFGAISVGFFVFAPLGVRLAGGARYAGAVPLLRIMAPIPWILGMSGLYATQFMLGLGYQTECTRIIVVGALLNFVILLPLLRAMDAAQAVAITGTAVEFWILMGSWIFYRLHRDKVVLR